MVTHAAVFTHVATLLQRWIALALAEAARTADGRLTLALRARVAAWDELEAIASQAAADLEAGGEPERAALRTLARLAGAPGRTDPRTVIVGFAAYCAARSADESPAAVGQPLGQAAARAAAFLEAAYLARALLHRPGASLEAAVADVVRELGAVAGQLAQAFGEHAAGRHVAGHACARAARVMLGACGYHLTEGAQ